MCIYQAFSVSESVGEFVNNQLLCLDLVFLCQITDLALAMTSKNRTDILTQKFFWAIARWSNQSHLFRIVQVISSLLRSYLFFSFYVKPNTPRGLFEPNRKNVLESKFISDGKTEPFDSKRLFGSIVHFLRANKFRVENQLTSFETKRIGWRSLSLIPMPVSYSVVKLKLNSWNYVKLSENFVFLYLSRLHIITPSIITKAVLWLQLQRICYFRLYLFSHINTSQVLQVLFQNKI